MKKSIKVVCFTAAIISVLIGLVLLLHLFPFHTQDDPHILLDMLKTLQSVVGNDTAQTPSSLAEKLGIPQITNVIWSKSITELNSTWTRITNNEREDIKILYPALVAVSNTELEIIPNINGYINAQNTEINILNADDIHAEPSKIGLKGSPTLVKKAYCPSITRNTTTTAMESPIAAAKIILDEIHNL